jgi:hypothetical protein
MGPTCPSTVQFTCIGQDITLLRWYFDDVQVAQYSPGTRDEDRVPFTVTYDGDLGPIQIINVQDSPDSDHINVTSIFTTNTSVLERYNNIQCGAKANRSELVLNISVIGKFPGLTGILRWHVNLWLGVHGLQCASDFSMTLVSCFSSPLASKLSVLKTSIGHLAVLTLTYVIPVT